MYIAKKIEKTPDSVLKSTSLLGKRSILKGTYAMHTKFNGCNGKVISIRRTKKECELFSIKYLNPFECDKDNYVCAPSFPSTLKKLKKENGLSKGIFLEELLIPNKYEPIIELSEESHTFERDLAYCSLKSYICTQGPELVCLTHNYTGWQQFIDGYIYRDINDASVVKIDSAESVPYILNDIYLFEKNTILTEYDNMMKSIRYADYNFSIPLLLYMFFGKNKSLFQNFSHSKKIAGPNDFLLHISSNNNYYNNQNMVEYISHLNQNFFDTTNKNIKLTSSLTAINKNINLKIPRFKKPIILRDIPVLKYNSNFYEKGTITPNALANALNSQIAYMFFNLNNAPQEAITLNCVHTPNCAIYDKNFDFSLISFPNFVKDYLIYISEKISLSIMKKEHNRKKNIIETYKETYTKMLLIIEKYVEYVFLEHADRSVDRTVKFIQSMKLKDYTRYLKQFDDDQFLFFKKIDNDYYARVETESPALYFGAYNDIEELFDYAKEKYNECVINEYLKNPKYHDDYFDTLYALSLKKLSSSKSDKSKVKRYAYLLATLESLNEYISDRLPEKKEHFDDFYNEAYKVLLTHCQTTLYRDIKGLLKLFAEFIQEEMADDHILDKNSGIEAKLGWVDYKKNELLLRNTATFYQEFTLYAYNNGEQVNLSKTEFVRKILAGNHLTTLRTAGKIKRFDRTRKINGSKVEVLVINFERLMLHLKL